jgi:hypothetical protein
MYLMRAVLLHAPICYIIMLQVGFDQGLNASPAFSDIDDST